MSHLSQPTSSQSLGFSLRKILSFLKWRVSGSEGCFFLVTVLQNVLSVFLNVYLLTIVKQILLEGTVTVIASQLRSLMCLFFSIDFLQKHPSKSAVYLLLTAGYL